VTLEQSVTQLDALLCVGASCYDGAIDLAASGLWCAYVGGTQGEVCLSSVVGESGSYAVEATFDDPGPSPPGGDSGPAPPSGNPYHLVLSDHSTHATLLDVTRVASYSRAAEVCGQRCWSAEMSF
jgi:hypothetical protein